MVVHRTAQIRPRTKTAIDARPHPSTRQGRSHGYAVEFRIAAVSASHHQQFQNSPFLLYLRAQGQWASRASIYRWRQRQQALGHLRRYRRTGNIRSVVLKGTMLLSLAMWRVIWPRGTHAEANVWLFHSNGQTRFYQPSQISLAEDSLGLTIKRASVQARQSMNAINIQLRWNYWYLPCPFGIANIPRWRLIDIDEAALFVELSNRSRGKCSIVRRVRDIGPYGHSEKLNILVAITGEDAAPGQSAHRWADTWRDGGTTIVRFIAFIARILQDIGPGTPQNFHVFTMDNLNTHRNLLVQQMIHAAGHRCVFRAPYYPVDSPIEHLFNSIQVDLSLAMYRIFTPQQLKDEFLASLRRFREFVPFFEKVGMR
jgi:hypothetical protein